MQLPVHWFNKVLPESEITWLIYKKIIIRNKESTESGSHCPFNNSTRLLHLSASSVFEFLSLSSPHTQTRFLSHNFISFFPSALPRISCTCIYICICVCKWVPLSLSLSLSSHCDSFLFFARFTVRNSALFLAFNSFFFLIFFS